MNNNRRKIFFDGEFCKLSTNINFLSVAFITDNGKSLYLEIEQDINKCDEWVRDNVIPHLKQKKISVKEAVEQIRDFIENEYGEEKPILVADVNQFDWIGLAKMFGVWNMPFFYIPLDFSTMLYAKGIDIDEDRMQMLVEHHVDLSQIDKHNALDDVKVMKALYDIYFK